MRLSPPLPAAPSRPHNRTGSRDVAAPWLAALAVVASLPSCSSAEKRVPLDVPAAARPSSDIRVGEEVARLLSPDAPASDAAALALEGLDDDGKKALAAHAARIPRETDPRWLTVLDANGLLPSASPEVRVDLLAWQAARKDPRLVWRAQSGLLDLARAHPEIVLTRLADPKCPARDALALALADAKEMRAIPALVELYRAPRTPAERRAATVALGRLAGEDRKPRFDATDLERARDADRLLAWYRTTGATDAKR